MADGSRARSNEIVYYPFRKSISHSVIPPYPYFHPFLYLFMQFYEAAAEEPVPTYRCELAKSNRSSCAAKGKARTCEKGTKLEKGELRIGSIDTENGGYRYWVSVGV